MPSICCRIRKTATNSRVAKGPTISIRKTPTAHPMKAPKTGIRAVKEISTPTSRA